MDRTRQYRVRTAAGVVALVGVDWLRKRAQRSAEGHGEHVHGEENTYGLPQGEALAGELRGWFEKQREAVHAAIPDGDDAPQTLPTHLPDLAAAEWTGPMASAVTPYLETTWSESGKDVYARMGLDPGDWKVTNPHLKHQIERQAFNFCSSTNRTTTLGLETALKKLRNALVVGLVEEGEALPQLRIRVNEIFAGLSGSKAEMIAATEASRAVHAAQEVAAAESGVVAGLELLLSSDACPLCRKIYRECKQVRLGQAFAVIGENPTYSHIKYPPLHPRCQCTTIEVLKPEYGGPAGPKWGETLIQPQKGLGKEPPGGEPPKPEVEKKQEPPRVPGPKPKPKPKPAPPAAEPETPVERAEGIIAGAGVKVRRVDMATAAGELGPSRARDVPAYYNNRTDEISINAQQPYWADPAKAMRRAYRTRWFSSADPDHVTHHEIGHALHVRSAGIDEYRRIVRSRFGDAKKALVRRHVSAYGATQPVEFVAEVYAGMAAGKSYNEQIMGLYRELKGPNP
jgi:hypothetical protein